MGGVQVIWGECIAGALYINDFLRIAKDAGFADPRILHQGPVAIHDADIQVHLVARPTERAPACNTRPVLQPAASCVRFNPGFKHRPI